MYILIIVVSGDMSSESLVQNHDYQNMSLGFCYKVPGVQYFILIPFLVSIYVNYSALLECCPIPMLLSSSY